jgi:integrase
VVTGPLASPGDDRGGVLSQLMAVVRPEFRADVLVFAADDPVFGGGVCLVPGCRRHARGWGLCSGHRLRWQHAGRPDLDIFVATTDSRWARQRPNAVCRVAACGYGVARDRMCQLHAQRWQRDGRPDLAAWLAEPPAVKQPAPGAVCRVEHCSLWPQAAQPFCHAHANTWKVNGRPDIDQFAARFTESAEVLADARVDLHALGRQLKLEVGYALQCRHDERTVKTPPLVVMRMVRFLAETGAHSLLDRNEAQWRSSLERSTPRDSNARALLAYAHRKVEDLLSSGGWEAEYPRDIWRLHRLGFPGRRTLRFDGIAQPWLVELSKRWIRWRLSTGLGLEAAGRPLRVITRFAGFLDTIGVERIDQLDRPVLERYLADLHSEMAGSQTHGSHIGLLNAFFGAIRQHRWNEKLPAGATFFTEDYPKRPERLPRALAEHVMTQLEHEANLDRWDNPAYRLITVILMRCGLRVTDALRLASDCVVTDADGAPYLRYVNHKMKRDALVPIDEQLRGMLGEQVRRNTERWPVGTPGLFPRPNQERRRHRAGRQLDLPAGALSLVGPLRDPRRARPTGAPHPAPVAPLARHKVDQQRRAAGGGAPNPRSRVPRHGRALRAAARQHRAPALGESPQGQRFWARGEPRPGRAAGRSGLGQTPPGASHPSTAERLLRPARPEELSARQRVLDLPDVRHDARVLATAPRTATRGHADHLHGRGPRTAARRRDEPARAGQPRCDHRGPRRRRRARRAAGRRCELTTART